MAVTKFLVLAFVALASVQFGSSEVLTLGFRSQTAVSGGVQHVIENIKQSSHKNLRETVENLKAGLSGVHYSIEADIRAVDHEVRKFVAKTFDDIKQMRLAAASNKDVSSCVKEQEGKIREVVKKVSGEVSVCAAPIVSEMTRIFNESVEDLNRINEELLVLIDEYDSCKDPMCRMNAAMKIMEKSFEINWIMRDKVTEVMYVINTNKEQVRQCIRKSVDGVKEQVQGIVADIKECNGQ